MRPLAAALAGLVTLGAAAAPAPAQDAAVPLYAAHRGGALLWPENSLLAFRGAVGLGADYLELDVHLTRDRALAVIHDPVLDRTTTGSGPVAARTLEEIRALRLKDRDGRVTSQSVPTLDEVLELAAAHGRRVLLEIKADHERRRYPGIEELVLAALDRHRMAARAVVMAFERETWLRVRALRPDVDAGALYSPRMLERDGTRAAAAVEAAARAGAAFVGLHQALVDADAVAAARRAKVLLGAWTVNERDAMTRVIQAGVDVVITDRPDLARELLGR